MFSLVNGDGDESSKNNKKHHYHYQLSSKQLLQIKMIMMEGL